jgi:hypothetical protein
VGEPGSDEVQSVASNNEAEVVGVDYIIEPLLPLAFPVAELEFLPGNARRGDVNAVAKSLKKFGQRKPIVARREEDGRNIVLAGNTTLKAAQSLGWEYIAVVFTDDDDQVAAAFAIADNRTHDLGTYDTAALAELLKKVADDSLRDAAGYDLADTQEVFESVQTTRNSFVREVFDDGSSDVPEAPTKKREKAAQTAIIQFNIVFQDEDQQQTWYRFVRWLKNTVEGDTLAERLTNFLNEIVGEDG